MSSHMTMHICCMKSSQHSSNSRLLLFPPRPTDYRSIYLSEDYNNDLTPSHIKMRTHLYYMMNQIANMVVTGTIELDIETQTKYSLRGEIFTYCAFDYYRVIKLLEKLDSHCSFYMRQKMEQYVYNATFRRNGYEDVHYFLRKSHKIDRIFSKTVA